MCRGGGVEIADSGTRLVVVRDASPGAHRWHTRLKAPPTPGQAADAIAGLVARACSEDALPRPIERLGVAVWGTVDTHGERVRQLRYAVGWEDVPFAAMLAERCGLPTRLATATEAAARAEARYGAARELENFAYVLAERSISAALCAGGCFMRGEHGLGGTLAHLQVVPDRVRCSCGAYGHLEPLASAQGLVRNFIGRASASEEGTAAMLRITSGRAEAIRVAQVVALADAGEPAAVEALQEALRALGIALAHLNALFDPGTVVLAGPLAEAGELLIEALAMAVAAHCMPPLPVPRLRAATLGLAAVVSGAALLSEMESPAR